MLCSFSRKSGHRLRPTRICCALCSVLFQENRATDFVPHGFAVLCALFFFKKIRPQSPPHGFAVILRFPTKSTDCAPHGFAVLCALSVLFQANRATEWASHGFAVLFMISNEIHRLHPTRICWALHDYQGNLQIAPHTHSLCSVLFQENRATDCAPHGFAVLCALFFFKKIGPQSPPHGFAVLFRFPTKSTDCAPHGFAVLSMIIKEIQRSRSIRISCALSVLFPTQIRCALLDFQRNP